MDMQELALENKRLYDLAIAQGKELRKLRYDIKKMKKQIDETGNDENRRNIRGNPRNLSRYDNAQKRAN